jgi:hypothetical protein
MGSEGVEEFEIELFSLSSVVSAAVRRGKAVGLEALALYVRKLASAELSMVR